LTSAAVSKLSEQRLKLDEPKNKMDSKMNKRNNEESCGRSKDLKMDLKMMKMTVSLLPDEGEVVLSERLRSSTSQTKGHAGPSKK
jgi:hypothetical protein